MALEKIRLKHGSPEWIAFRRTGIGGSDAAAILGLSPFKSNIEVWEEKVGLREPEDISDKPQVQYGTKAEDMLVKLFALDYPQYKVRQDKQTVYRRGFMFASLDGELTEIETKARGFIEIKTTEIHSTAALQKWDGHVPEYYYLDVRVAESTNQADRQERADRVYYEALPVPAQGSHGGHEVSLHEGKRVLGLCRAEAKTAAAIAPD